MKIIILTDYFRPSFVIVGKLYSEMFRSIGCQVLEYSTPEKESMRQSLSKEAAGKIVMHNTSGERFIPLPGCWNIAMPVHEWSRYPEPWSRKLNSFNEIWVTSKHVRSVLINSNIKKPIHFLPPGINTVKSRYKTKWEVKLIPKFYFCGEPHFRKGHHLLIDGFLRAFPVVGEASLTIKTNFTCDWEPPRADIFFDKRNLNRKQMLDTYAKYDFYITASMGEGLGLPVAEAILANLPVAANFWGGHKSLLKKGSFFRIPHRLIDQPYSSRPEYYANKQKCAFSDSTQVANTFRILTKYKDVEDLRRITHSARAHLLDNYGVVNARKKIKGRLEEIQAIIA